MFLVSLFAGWFTMSVGCVQSVSALWDFNNFKMTFLHDFDVYSFRLTPSFVCAADMEILKQFFIVKWRPMAIRFLLK